MLQICQLGKRRISSLFEKAARSNFIPTRSLISGNKNVQRVFILICVRAARNWPCDLQEATPHWASLYRGWKGAQSSDSHKRPVLFSFFLLSVTVSAAMRVSLLPHGCRAPLLSVHTALLCRCQYSHSPPSNPGYATQESHNMRPVPSFRDCSGNPNPFHGE